MADKAIQSYFLNQYQVDGGFALSEDRIDENTKLYGHHFEMVDGVIALVMAQAIAPLNGTVLPEGAPYVLLTRKIMTDEIVGQIQKRMGIENFAFTQDAQESDNSYHMEIANSDGIFAKWRSSLPSQEIWQQTKWKVLAGLLALIASFYLFVARYGGSIRALSEREEKSKHLAYHDPLTGLANRAKLDETLQGIWNANKQSDIAVVWVDLDKFKPINDTWGHQAGDMVLKAVSSRLNNTASKHGLVARVGGDEFVIVVNDAISTKQLKDFSDLLLSEVRKPINIGDFSVQVEASIGITLGREGALSSADLMREADHALYVAKNAGRGRAEIVDLAGAKKQLAKANKIGATKKAS